jgi:trans-aconitate methyltransferase
MNDVFDRRSATAFDDVDVARCYQFRPAYPQALYDAILELTPGRGAVLDLGCGPGKLAGPLADHFARVDAVDPSAPMLAAAACAGASVHWFDHGRLMPRLAQSLGNDAWMMVVEGDGAWQPPWQAEWSTFIARWLERIGRRHDEAEFLAEMNRYREFMAIHGQREFTTAVEQSLEDFIECQHSRASWARSAMGYERCGRFDAELEELLTPHLRTGALHFQVRTTLIWGRPSL